MKTTVIAVAAVLAYLLPAGTAMAAFVTSGLEIHLDAGQLTGLSDGDSVTSWADISGNSRDLDTVGGTAPKYYSDAMNSRPAVRFSGGGLYGDFSINTFTPSVGTTVFVAFRSLTTSQGTFVSLDQVGADVNQAFLYNNRFQTGDLFASFDASSGDNNSGQNLDDGYNQGRVHVFTAIGDSTGTDSVTLRADGGREALTHNDGVPLNTLDGYSVGVLNNLTSSRYTGDIAEILVYGRVLTSEEIAQNERYLMTKYSPEPATMLIWSLLAGLGVALGWRRRKV